VLSVTNTGNRPIRLIRVWVTATPTHKNPWDVTQQYHFDQVLSEENRRAAFAFDVSVLPAGYLVTHIEVEADSGEKFSIQGAQAELIGGFSTPGS
jgi:hypothetical protein